MASPILYSIVVPVFGVEKYLKKCVDSLMGQTYYNIEIILVDDGAKDSSPAICDHYAQLDPRIKVLHKKNGGLVSARKAGAQLATGEYLLCVDGDDWVSTNYVQQLDQVIRQHRPDVVCCGYIQTDEVTHRRFLCEIPGGYYEKSELEQTLYPLVIEDEKGISFSPHVWAKAFRRELYLPEQLAVEDAIKIGEDGAVVKPILTKAQNLCILDECLYYYRVNFDSMTKNRTPFDWNGPSYLYRHLQQRLPLDAFDFEAQLHRYIGRQIYTVVVSQFHHQQSYLQIRKDILTRLKQSEYQKILKKSHYKGLKTRVEIFLLRAGILLPIRLFHR